jgi:hypothetical protein
MEIDGYLNSIKGQQSFDQGLSCTFHIIKDLAGEHSAQKLFQFVR